jgi:uncharacterized delta-60 repeat protein
MYRALIVPLLTGLATAPAWGAGQLDPAFGDGGALVLDTGLGSTNFDWLSAGLIDSGGRYVGVGYGAPSGANGGTVVRLLPNGTRDPAFGSNGVARLPRIDGLPSLWWVDVEEQPDGKLLVAGRAANILAVPPRRAWVCRMLSNGAPDPTFGNGGCTQPMFGQDSQWDSIDAMALQSDGRIVLTGEADVAGDGLLYENFVARLDADGGYDLCFADPSCTAGGVVVDAVPDLYPADVALAPDGRIVVAGRREVMGTTDMAVMRLLPTGDIDQNFSGDGVAYVAFDESDFGFDAARAVVVRGDGSIVIAGEVGTELGELGGIAALDVGGTLIPTFGTQGKRLLFFNDVSPIQVPNSLSLQDDGKLVVTGYYDDIPLDGTVYIGCGAARFDAGGELDPDFGFNGYIGFDSHLGTDSGRAEGCNDGDVDGDTIVLFGQSRPDPSDEDSLFFRLDRDRVFGDGYEEP